MEYNKQELLKMLHAIEVRDTELRMQDPADVYTWLERFRDRKKEHYIVIGLDGAHKELYTEVITIGIADRTLVHPREVFYRAIVDNAVGIVVAHNHPSGSTVPSPEDQELTHRLVKAGELLGIPVLDHLIVTINGYYSFLGEGALV